MSRMMFAKLKQQRFGAPRAYAAARVGEYMLSSYESELLLLVRIIHFANNCFAAARWW